ncbi:MAG: NosD domain-containing protein, partial [Methermicoccaceae archaeon]
NVSNSDVTGCVFGSQPYGIFIRKGNDNRVISNSISAERYGVVTLLNSNRNEIVSNSFIGGYGGIYSSNTLSTKIESNSISSVQITGMLLKHADECIVSSNEIASMKYGIELYGSDRCVVRSNNVASAERAGVLFVEGSDYNDLVTNSVSNAYYGVYVHDSYGNNISTCSISSSSLGVYLGNATATRVSDNSIEADYGIYLRRAIGNTLIDNLVQNVNDYGIVLHIHSDENTLYGNNVGGGKKGVLYVGSSSNKNTISNEIYTNSGDGTGIVVVVSSDNIFNQCSVRDVDTGIYLLEGESNTISASDISASRIGIYIENGSRNNIVSNHLTDFSVSGVLVGGESTNVLNNSIEISGARSEIGISIESPSNHVVSNNISGKSCAHEGVHIEGGNGQEIRGNTLMSLSTGVWVLGGDDSTIINNTFVKCTYGIQLWNDVDRTLIVGNTIDKSVAGVFVMGARVKVDTKGEVSGGSEVSAGELTSTPHNTTVTKNILANNKMDISFLWGDPTAEIHYNDLSKGVYGVSALSITPAPAPTIPNPAINVSMPPGSSVSSINATYNWWGAEDGPGPVGDGHGVRVTPSVLYKPWLRESPI